MSNELCKCGKVGIISCPNDERCGKPNNQLPADKKSILEKHCPSMSALFLDKTGLAFRERILKAMEDYGDKLLHKERNAMQAKITGMEVGYLKQIKRLLDTLEVITKAPVPANDREYMSWFVTVKNIAGGAISEYEAEIEAQQWKEGKEQVYPDKCTCRYPSFNPMTDRCLICNRLTNQPK